MNWNTGNAHLLSPFGNDFPKPIFKITVRRSPPKLTSQLRHIDCIAPIMTGAITHPIDEVAGLAHCLKNRLQDLKITPLTIGANQISLPQPTLVQNGPYSTGMVINVNPITNIFAVAIQPRAPTMPNALYRCRDELLFVLQRTVVVAAIRNSNWQAICASPRTNKQIRAHLGCCIGRTRAIGRILPKAHGVFQSKIAKNLVRVGCSCIVSECSPPVLDVIVIVIKCIAKT